MTFFKEETEVFDVEKVQICNNNQLMNKEFLSLGNLTVTHLKQVTVKMQTLK